MSGAVRWVGGAWRAFPERDALTPCRRRGTRNLGGQKIFFGGRRLGRADGKEFLEYKPLSQHMEKTVSRALRASHSIMSAAAALASLAARSSAATPSSPVGPLRLTTALLNNVNGPGTAGAASSPKFSSTC